MSIICKDNEIIIRNLENTSDDMNCILKWLNNKNVSDYYGDSRMMGIIIENSTDINIQTICYTHLQKHPP